MTNRIALWIGLLLLAVFTASFAFGLDWHIFLGRKLLELIDYIAIWR